MQTLWQDLRYGAQMLLKQPGFAFVFTFAVSILTRIIIGLIPAWAAIGCAVAMAQEAKPGKLVIEPYKLQTFDGKEIEAELGRLWTPENRESHSNQRLIQLAFVRLRTAAQKPEPPIIYLAGGPGMSGITMGQIPVFFPLFDRLREVADVILLDQRGTGMSSPNLSCPPPKTSAPPDVLADQTKALAFYTSNLRACADHFRSQGVDLAAYTSNAIADDVDDLRQALGVEKVSLLGHSYGTHLALATVRRHNAHLHRLVLVGTCGMDQVLPLPGAQDALLLRLSQLVAQNANLSKSVPDFAALVRQVLDQFDKKPAPLAVTDKLTNRPVSLTVGKYALQRLLGGMSDGRIAPTLPALFYALNRGDYAPLKSRIEGIYNSIGSGSAMSTAVVCSSGWSAERMAKAQQEAQRSVVGSAAIAPPGVCEFVGHPDLGPEFRGRILSATPTLFLSGALDAQTPPYYAEEVRWGFLNGVHLIVENAPHDIIVADEAHAVVVDFFKGQDVSGRKISLPPYRFRLPEGANAR
jgi:pimeloyl-ACP methyl ester carboxylesterase